MDLLRRVVEQFGNLVSVAGTTDFAPEPGDLNSRFCEYVFFFVEGSLVITAESVDDAVRLSDDGATRIHYHRS